MTKRRIKDVQGCAMRQKGQNMAHRLFDLHPHVCKQCGKRFEGTVNYVYKELRSKDSYWWFCSWHCLREFRKNQQKAG